MNEALTPVFNAFYNAGWPSEEVKRCDPASQHTVMERMGFTYVGSIADVNYYETKKKVARVEQGIINIRKKG